MKFIIFLSNIFLISILVKFIASSNSKLKLLNIIYSNTDYVFQNSSFRNIENGEVLLNVTHIRYVDTISEIVSIFNVKVEFFNICKMMTFFKTK